MVENDRNRKRRKEEKGTEKVAGRGGGKINKEERSCHVSRISPVTHVHFTCNTCKRLRMHL